MHKSKEVQLVLVTAVAMAMLGCRDERRDCVDGQNRLQPDSACQAGATGAHYIYGGSSGGRVGDTVVGGSVSRGGFGAIGGGDAGGE